MSLTLFKPDPIVQYNNNNNNKVALTKSDVVDLIDFADKNKGYKIGRKTALGLGLIAGLYWASPSNSNSYGLNGSDKSNFYRLAAEETYQQASLESAVGLGYGVNYLLGSINPWQKHTAFAIGAAHVVTGFIKDSGQMDAAVNFFTNNAVGKFAMETYSAVANAVERNLLGGPVEIQFFNMLKSDTQKEFAAIIEILQVFDATSKKEFEPGYLDVKEGDEIVKQECFWSIAQPYELELVITNAILSIEMRIEKYLKNVQDSKLALDIKTLLNNEIEKLVNIRILTNVHFPNSNLDSREIEANVAKKLNEIDSLRIEREIGYIERFTRGLKNRVYSFFSSEIETISKKFKDETLRMLGVRVADDPNANDEKILDFIKQAMSEIAEKNNMIEFDVILTNENGERHIYTIEVNTLEIIAEGKERTMDLIQSIPHRLALDQDLRQVDDVIKQHLIDLESKEGRAEDDDDVHVIEFPESSEVQVFSAPPILVKPVKKQVTDISYEEIMKVRLHKLDKEPANGREYDPDNRVTRSIKPGIKPIDPTKVDINIHPPVPFDSNTMDESKFLILNVPPSELGSVLWEPIQQFLEDPRRDKYRMYTEAQKIEKIRELTEFHSQLYGTKETKRLQEQYYNKIKDDLTPLQQYYIKTVTKDILGKFTERTSYVKGALDVMKIKEKIRRYTTAMILRHTTSLVTQVRSGDATGILSSVLLILSSSWALLVKLLTDEDASNFSLILILALTYQTGLPTRLFRLVSRGMGSSITALFSLKELVTRHAITNRNILQQSEKSDHTYAQRVYQRIQEARVEPDPVLHEQKLLQVETDMMIHEAEVKENAIVSVQFETKFGHVNINNQEDLPDIINQANNRQQLRKEQEVIEQSRNRFEVVEEEEKPVKDQTLEDVRQRIKERRQKRGLI